MTEAEAKTKLCPKMFGWVPSPTAVAEWQYGLCSGSNCMAWREDKPETINKPVGLEPEGGGWIKDGEPTGIGGAVTHRQQWKRLRFYCGLAGRP